MKKNNILKIIVLMLLGCAAGVAAGGQCEFWEQKNLGYVVVSPNGPDDGGDFGPLTPGTLTSGFQEAINFAWANGKDVFVVGGGLNNDRTIAVMYHSTATVYIPPGRGKCITGDEYWLFHHGAASEPSVFIDSQINGNFKFGTMVGGSAGPDQMIFHIKPTTAVPGGQVQFEGNYFHFNALVGTGGTFNGSDMSVHTGTGIVMDGSLAPAGICNNKFYFGEVIICKLGIYLKENVRNNLIESPWVHWLVTGAQIGTATTGSTVEANTLKLIVGPDIYGVRLFGRRNFFHLIVGGSPTPYSDVIFESPAYENLIVAGNLSQRFTNSASTPTNRIITAAMPIGYQQVTTPAMPASGVDKTNTYPFTVEVQIFLAGNVSAWTVTDAAGLSQTFNGGLSVGKSFILNPNCKVRFTYSSAPSWRWMGRN